MPEYRYLQQLCCIPCRAKLSVSQGTDPFQQDLLFVPSCKSDILPVPNIRESNTAIHTIPQLQ